MKRIIKILLLGIIVFTVSIHSVAASKNCYICKGSDSKLDKSNVCLGDESNCDTQNCHYIKDASSDNPNACFNDYVTKVTAKDNSGISDELKCEVNEIFVALHMNNTNKNDVYYTQCIPSEIKLRELNTCYEYNFDLPVFDDPPSREGYTFKDWNVPVVPDEGNNGKYSSRIEITTLHLYAMWEKDDSSISKSDDNTITVTFEDKVFWDVVKGEELGKLPSFLHSKYQSCFSNDNSGGAHFCGYYYEGDDGVSVVTTKTSFNEDINLKSYSCQAVPVYVTLELNDGELSEEDISSLKISSEGKVFMLRGNVIELPIPIKEGYKFNGWYTEKEDGEKVKKSLFVQDNVTYYAHWVSENSTQVDEPEEIPDTGDAVIYFTVILVFLAISYSIYYFKRQKENT